MLELIKSVLYIIESNKKQLLLEHWNNENLWLTWVARGKVLEDEGMPRETMVDFLFYLLLHFSDDAYIAHLPIYI